MNKKFPPQSFFDLSKTSFKRLFSNLDNVWEALSKIDFYIKEEFKSGKLTGNYDKKRDVYIGKNTVIQKGALIEDGVVIGDNCFIGHCALIRGNCILGNGVHIGHACEIKHSILFDNAAAAHLNYIGDSIIGNRVNVSGGAILANFRFDKKKVSVKTNAGAVETGLEKFGAVVADDCVLGVGCVLNPGTVLGKSCIVYPLVSVSGTYGNNEKIKAL